MSSIKSRHLNNAINPKQRERSSSQKKKFMSSNLIKNKENQPSFINKIKPQQPVSAPLKQNQEIRQRVTTEVQTEYPKQSLKDRVSSVIETESVFETAQRHSHSQRQSQRVSQVEEQVPEIINHPQKKSSLYSPAIPHSQGGSSFGKILLIIGMLLVAGVCLYGVSLTTQIDTDYELQQSDSRQASQVSQMILDQLKLSRKSSKEQVRDEFLKFITCSTMWSQVVKQLEQSPYLSTVVEDDGEYWIYNDLQ